MIYSTNVLCYGSLCFVAQNHYHIGMSLLTD